MSDIRKELKPCPFPEFVYLADSYIQQNINGHEQIVGMFVTDKPTVGAAHEYTRAHDIDGLIAEIEDNIISGGGSENPITQGRRLAYNEGIRGAVSIIRKHFGKE